MRTGIFCAFLVPIGNAHGCWIAGHALPGGSIYAGHGDAYVCHREKRSDEAISPLSVASMERSGLEEKLPAIHFVSCKLPALLLQTNIYKNGFIKPAPFSFGNIDAIPNQLNLFEQSL